MIKNFIHKKNKKTILIVDDAVENLKLLAEILRDDYVVKVAKEGKKAVELVNSDNSINLILLDVVMPEMDGFETSRLIKENKATHHIPIIFLTGLNDAENEAMGFKLGGADFITKPFNVEVIKARIKTHLALQEEQQKVEELLKVLLPEKVIHQLIHSGKYSPELHTNTTIMFCDLIDFTKLSATLSPEALVEEMSEIFYKFDEIVYKNNGIRIKTIGDGYLAITGLGINDTSHAENMVNTGIEIIEYLENKSANNDVQWKCRIGIHSGEVISGIIGKQRFQFDIMGDNVNIASRIESNAVSMKVTITEETHSLLPKEKFNINSIGEVFIKGKGDYTLFTVENQAVPEEVCSTVQLA